MDRGADVSGLAHFFGLDNLSGPFYGFWSGIGSDIGELAIIGGLIQIYRQHLCHVDGCYRWGRRSVEGTPHIVCHRHHPKPRPSAQDVLDDHARAQKATEASPR